MSVPYDPAGAGDLSSIRSSQASSVTDFGELVENLDRLRPRMTALARRFAPSRDVAEDIVQNAFEKAVRGWQRFQGRSKCSTWLHRIVVNEALMWLRAEKRRSRRFPSLGEQDAEFGAHWADPAPDPGRQLLACRRSQRLRECVAALPPCEREVIEACALRGRSYAEYASAAGIGRAAAKSRAFRARQRLRQLLDRP